MGFSDLMGGGNEGGGGFFTHKEDGCMPSLTYQQRLWGFGACFVAGGILTFIGTLAWIPGSKHNAFKDPGAFAIPYTLGNIVAMLSTGFLWGFKSQCKNMWKPVRRVATAVYLLFLVLTLIVCFTVKTSAAGAIIVVLVIGQMIALFWYCASYIPFARTMIKNCAKSMCKC